MKLGEVLNGLSDEALDQLAADKVDEVSSLRLPRPVLVQEVSGALSSLSYVAGALAPPRPPTYAFLKLLLEAEGYMVEAQGFREQVLATTESLTQRVARGDGLSTSKNYDLYLTILRTAFENDGVIDRSEALLLQALRESLGIWTREHLLLEHHPSIRPFWDGGHAFERARNHLLSTGLVLTHGTSYLIAEEVADQIRQAWDMVLPDGAYARLLERFTGQQLRTVLEAAGLPLSGSKQERIERVLGGMVPAAEALDTLSIQDLKTVCREEQLTVSLTKSELRDIVIEHFAAGRDLESPPELPEDLAPPPEPEDKVLNASQFQRLFAHFTMDQLYDMLASRNLKRSGSKSARIERLWASPWAESSLMEKARRADLSELCRQLLVPVSGVKGELIERLLDWARSSRVSEIEAPEPTPAAPSSVEAVMEQPGAAPASSPAGVPSGGGRSGAPALPGWRDITSDFPQLPHEEQVLLALLREARSLTEPELERVVATHKLGWTLTKAHMADLLARLSQQDSVPLRIRSAGNVNIYEWVEPSPPSGESGLSRAAARDIIDAIRHGVVPERHLDRLMVSQNAARQHLSELLEHVRSGRSEFKFIRGPYGSGKTFLCSWLRERALDLELAVSSVRIGPDQPLSDLPIFFSGLVSGLRTPEKRQACALPDVLESWLLSLQRRTAQLEGLDVKDPAARKQLGALVSAGINAALASLAAPGFAPALAAFYRARLSGDSEGAAAALSWLRGSRNLSSASLRALGVRGQLEPDQVLPRLKALLEVIRGGRCRGLLILVDELELVRRMPHARQREQSYETLRLLIDEVGENALPGCLLIFTGTDALFDDKRYGLGSYEALLNRVVAPASSDGLTSMRQPVIRLEPLDRTALLQVTKNIREIHGVAYDWQAPQRLSDQDLEYIVDTWTSFGGDDVTRLPRPTLRELVHVLDVCEENPGVTAEQCLRRPRVSASGAGELAAILGD